MTFGCLNAEVLSRFSRVDEQKRRPGDSQATTDERGVASAIYGLVVCSATLAAASASGELSFVAVSVLVTVIVYWLAESYAHALARYAVKREPLGWSGIPPILSQGWPMVSASFIPLGTLLAMGALGASVFVAINVSLAVATVLLVGAGWTASQASGLRGWRLLTSTAISALFGLSMVALKNLLHV
jgi:hypothetical protein